MDIESRSEGSARLHNLTPEVLDKIDQQFQEYKRFAFKDDMFRLAVAFVLGGAFGKMVSAISDCLMMPFLMFIISQTGSAWKTTVWSPIPGLVIEIGKLFGTTLEFVLISFVLFLIVKFTGGLRKPDESQMSLLRNRL